MEGPSLMPVLAQGQFLRQQFVQRLYAVDLALFDPAQGGIEHLERSRHPQTDQAVADIVEPRRRRSERHGRPAYSRQMAATRLVNGQCSQWNMIADPPDGDPRCDA